MAFQPSEQLLHDRINLTRLLRRLEKTVASPEWEVDTRQPVRATWIKTKGMLQSLQYARKLLQSVEQNDFDASPSTAQTYQNLSSQIDRIEHKLKEVEKRGVPPAVRPPPILPTIPLPPPAARGVATEVFTHGESMETRSQALESSGLPTAPTNDLLLSPADTIEPPHQAANPSTGLLPPSIPALPETSSSTGTGTPSLLQNSAALQEEMAEQLAKMATQLKRNATHFATSLEKDKAVVSEAQEKMERNYDVMSNERVRLRDHRSKSWGTTWIVVLSIVVAAVGFILTFFVIRLT